MTNIHTLEAYTLRSWPALETEQYNGWVLRYANGYTGRSNSASPLFSSSLEVGEKIAYVEAWYKARNFYPRFKMTPAMQPPDLDAILQARGYTIESRSWMMQTDLTGREFTSDANVQLSSTIDDGWMDTFCRLNPSHAAHRHTMPKLLNCIQGEKYFAVVYHGDDIAAMGLAVREGDYVGLYDIVTAEHLRGRGIGKRLIGTLLAQAFKNGAKIGYLQVAQGNTAAIKLYSGIGFVAAYPYWYRAKSHS